MLDVGKSQFVKGDFVRGRGRNTVFVVSDVIPDPDGKTYQLVCHLAYARRPGEELDDLPGIKHETYADKVAIKENPHIEKRRAEDEARLREAEDRARREAEDEARREAEEERAKS